MSLSKLFAANLLSSGTDAAKNVVAEWASRVGPDVVLEWCRDIGSSEGEAALFDFLKKSNWTVNVCGSTLNAVFRATKDESGRDVIEISDVYDKDIADDLKVVFLAEAKISMGDPEKIEELLRNWRGRVPDIVLSSWFAEAGAATLSESLGSETE